METPLLIPSFSSKAVGPVEFRPRKGKVQLIPASQFHTGTLLSGIEGAVLISSYDIHFKFVADADRFRKRFKGSRYSEPRIVFIDSGWYEKSVGPASGQWYHEVGEALKFEEKDYEHVIDSLDANLQAVVVSWDQDNGGSYVEQMKAAQAFFGVRKRFTSDVLLKPEAKRQYHDFGELSSASAKRLQAFAIVGVTEKELGDTILSRLTRIAQLRYRLDEAGVDAPIHVFGGLDPVMTPLYFAAGAEIFDGLSWLRYAFKDGLSIHNEAIALLDGNFKKRFSLVVSHGHMSNLDAINQLSLELKVFFENDCEWSKLRRGEDLLKPAFDAMEASLGRQQHGR